MYTQDNFIKNFQRGIMWVHETQLMSLSRWTRRADAHGHCVPMQTSSISKEIFCNQNIYVRRTHRTITQQLFQDS